MTLLDAPRSERRALLDEPVDDPPPFDVVCVFGSREKWWRDPAAICDYVFATVRAIPRSRAIDDGATVRVVPTLILTGGADGVDRWAHDAATRLGFPTRVDAADWHPSGGAVDMQAGHKRNARNAAACHRAIGVHDGHSPGTTSMQRFLDSMVKPYVMHYPQSRR